MDKDSILVFGVGKLQKSIIDRARLMGLLTVGIDPCADAECRHDVDVFEIVGGQDYEGTLAVARKYGVKAVVTAATDKPLVMMARVAEPLGLPFYSVETAVASTDKLLMKERFISGGIPCARGITINCVEDAAGLHYPIIIKPRDNSGSRGVILCRNQEELEAAFSEAKANTRLDSVLAEEYIEGQEYSIESLHFNGTSKVIQFTEKKTTPFPYNVELGHIQPANLTNDQRARIEDIVAAIGKAMGFDNCASHTELKINERGIFIIETSPRLGGDYITSCLVPLSTGFNMEDALLHIALGRSDSVSVDIDNKASAVCFLALPEGEVTSMDNQLLSTVDSWPGLISFECTLQTGAKVPRITSSLSRYGQFIVQARDRRTVEEMLYEYNSRITKSIAIDTNE